MKTCSSTQMFCKGTMVVSIEFNSVICWNYISCELDFPTQKEWYEVSLCYLEWVLKADVFYNSMIELASYWRKWNYSFIALPNIPPFHPQIILQALLDSPVDSSTNARDSVKWND